MGGLRMLWNPRHQVPDILRVPAEFARQIPDPPFLDGEFTLALRQVAAFSLHLDTLLVEP